MRRLAAAAVAAFLLTLPPSAALGTDPGSGPVWSTVGDSARVTSCTTGNSGAIHGAFPDRLGTRISGHMRFCRDDGVRYFGIEFFTGLSGHGVAGYFFRYNGDTVEWNWFGSGLESVTAVCVSPRRDSRIACASARFDDATGTVSLTPIALNDPLVALPSGAMYFCENGKVINPTCATCV